MILRLLAAGCILLHLNACTTLNRVHAGTDWVDGGLRVGDAVVLTDKAGRTHEMVLARIERGQLCDTRACMPADEIAVVERREFSATKTTVLVVIVALAMLYAYATAVGSLMQWQ